MPNQEVALKGNDVAWSESILYSGQDFPKYNPDDLIGRKGYHIYRKMMLDDQVKAVVLFKRDAITSRDYMFTPHNEMSEAESVERIAVYTEALHQMEGTIFSALNGIMSAMYNGFSLTEKLYKQINVNGRTYWGIDKLKIKPFDSFRFVVDKFGNITDLIQELDNARQTLNIGDFIYFVNRPDIDDHYGQSELRECYRDWFSKDIAIKFRNIWLEKHATGFRWVEPSPDSDKRLRVGTAEYNAIVDMLENKSAGSGFILPSGYTMRFQFPSNNVAFDDAIAGSNMAIARSLLVPNLLGISEQGKYGSRALGSEQLESFLWTLDTIANNLAQTINAQLFYELGEANWGDDKYPQFNFKPVSEKRKHAIIAKWLEMVNAGTVRATTRDEDHLRELLEFPTRTDDDDETQNTITSLEAPKITALLDLASKVKNGALDLETACLIICHTLPLDKEQARELLETIEIEENDLAPLGSKLPDDSNVVPIVGASGVSPRGDADPAVAPPRRRGVVDETISGRSSTTVTATKEAYSRAVKRVAFAVIEQNTDAITELMALKLSAVINQGVRAVFEGVEDVASIDIAKIVFPGRIKTKLRATALKMLQKGWAIGVRHARDEIDKSRGQRFMRIDYERLGDNAEDFLKKRSFTMSGKLSDDAANEMRNQILLGLKNDKTVDEIIKATIEILIELGLVDAEVGEEWGVVLDVPNPMARLRTVVRTGLFEAVNEARTLYFQDPALEGWVQALEYSAILDARTTPLCEHLNGRIFASDADEWKVYTPPNHYNCRSLLIAVTEEDAWEASEPPDPEFQPAKGFK